MEKHKFIAHRGLHCQKLWAPENSPEAFRRALEYNFPIELDVRLTKDNEVIVIHDKNLLRLTGKNIEVSKVNFNEIMDLRLFNTSEHIPTLKEVLDIIQGKVPLYIEIKNLNGFAGKLESQVAEIMKNYKGYWCVISFNPLTLNWFYKQYPKVDRGQLLISPSSKLSFDSILKRVVSKSFCISKISHANVILPQISKTTLETAIKAVEDNCKLIPWTARDKKDAYDVLNYSDAVMFENFIP